MKAEVNIALLRVNKLWASNHGVEKKKKGLHKFEFISLKQLLGFITLH